MSLPNDYSRCTNKECERECARKEWPTNALRVVVSRFEGGKDCQGFIEVEVKK